MNPRPPLYESGALPTAPHGRSLSKWTNSRRSRPVRSGARRSRNRGRPLPEGAQARTSSGRPDRRPIQHSRCQTARTDLDRIAGEPQRSDEPVVGRRPRKLAARANAHRNSFVSRGGSGGLLVAPARLRVLLAAVRDFWRYGRPLDPLLPCGGRVEALPPVSPVSSIRVRIEPSGSLKVRDTSKSHPCTTRRPAD